MWAYLNTVCTLSAIRANTACTVGANKTVFAVIVYIFKALPAINTVETFVRCTLVTHVTHIAPVCAAVKAYTAAVTACAVLVYKASLAIGASLSVFNVALQAVMTVAFTTFAAAFVATPAVFTKLTLNNTNTAVYTMCAVIHSTFNAHIAILTPGAFTFGTIAADNTFYSGVINKAKVTAGTCHVIIKVTFVAYMVLTCRAFAVTFVAVSAVFTNSIVNLALTAFLTVTAVILCAFKAHVTFVAPLLSTLIALVADIAL